MSHPLRAADRGAVVGECAIACSRAVTESRVATEILADRTAVVDKGAIARGRAVKEVREADCAADRAVVVGEHRQIPRGRAVSECYRSKVASTTSHKVLGIPELFVRPTPLMVNVSLGVVVIVNALAPAPNTTPLTSVSAESKTSVTFDD